MNIAEKLIQLRNEKGLTQAQLGRELNIALSSIQNYENTNKPRIPEATILLKIAKYFDVDMEYLLDNELNNRKHNNIVIEKELKLKDESINVIKSFKDEDIIDTFNIILEDKKFKEIITKINIYCKSLYYLNYILDLQMLDSKKRYRELRHWSYKPSLKELLEYFKYCQNIILEMKKNIEKEYQLFNNIINGYIKAKDFNYLYEKNKEIVKILETKKDIDIFSLNEYIEYSQRINDMQTILEEYNHYTWYTISSAFSFYKDDIYKIYRNKKENIIHCKNINNILGGTLNGDD